MVVHTCSKFATIKDTVMIPYEYLGSGDDDEEEEEEEEEETNQGFVIRQQRCL